MYRKQMEQPLVDGNDMWTNKLDCAVQLRKVTSKKSWATDIMIKMIILLAKFLKSCKNCSILKHLKSQKHTVR